MKLSLRNSGDVSILTIAELRSAGDFAVLKAGIVNTLKKGKNRLVLELTNADAIPAEILRGLAQLRLLANELSGDLVLAGVRPELKNQVMHFSRPPVVSIFDSTQAALESFRKPASPAALSPEEGSPAVAAVADQKVKELREDIVLREKGELGQLRKEVERLRAENRSLRDLMASQLLSTRLPADLRACHEKIAILEDQLADVLGKPPEKKLQA